MNKVDEVMGLVRDYGVRCLESGGTLSDRVEAYAAIRTALSEIAAGWRLIDDQAKNGEAVDLWVEHRERPRGIRIPACWFDKDAGCWRDDENDRIEEWLEPTHYMPMPAPPTGTAT